MQSLQLTNDVEAYSAEIRRVSHMVEKGMKLSQGHENRSLALADLEADDCLEEAEMCMSEACRALQNLIPVAVDGVEPWTGGNEGGKRYIGDWELCD